MSATVPLKITPGPIGLDYLKELRAAAAQAQLAFTTALTTVLRLNGHTEAQFMGFTTDGSIIFSIPAPPEPEATTESETLTE